MAEEPTLIDDMTDGNGYKLTTISTAQQKKLMSGEWEHLELGGVTEISAEAAKALALSRLSSLSFPDLEYLPIDIAHELSMFNGYELEFHSLREISDELAKSFSGFRARSLVFDNVGSLSDEAALHLSRFGHPFEFGDESLFFFHCPVMTPVARSYLEKSPAFSDGDAERKRSGMSDY